MWNSGTVGAGPAPGGWITPPERVAGDRPALEALAQLAEIATAVVIKSNQELRCRINGWVHGRPGTGEMSAVPISVPFILGKRDFDAAREPGNNRRGLSGSRQRGSRGWVKQGNTPLRGIQPRLSQVATTSER